MMQKTNDDLFITFQFSQEMLDMLICPNAWSIIRIL